MIARRMPWKALYIYCDCAKGIGNTHDYFYANILCWVCEEMRFKIMKTDLGLITWRKKLVLNLQYYKAFGA